MIRLAVRCCAEQAELVLAELTVLAPNGVEEELGPGWVEYAIYGGEGELPDVGELEAAAGDGLVEVFSSEVPDDWADRWQDFHKPVLAGGRVWVAPSWEADGGAPDGAIQVVVDPGRAFGTGAHPTTRLCLELLIALEEAGEASGELVDLGTGSGVLAIAAAKLGWAPVRGYDHEAAAVEAAEENATANGVEIACERRNLREVLPPLAPTVVANLTAPILKDIARQVAGAPGEALRGNSGEAPWNLPRTLVLSGLLHHEVDGVAKAFEPWGLRESERRAEGDWAALLLRAAS